MDLDSLSTTLVGAVEGAVRFDRHNRGLYATDASIYQVTPMGAVVPSGTADAVAAVRVCGDARIPMLPRGGGTSLAGQCVNDAVVIDVSAACDRLLELDADNRRCRVEPGLTIDDLNDRIREHGLFFAPDPSTARQATIGGCIGNNAAGAHSVLYQRTSENVESIDACLWDGTRLTFGPGAARQGGRLASITDQVIEVVRAHADEIRARYPKTKRRSAGYQLDVILDQLESGDWDPGAVNLKDLLCGSEGTLAMTLGATLTLEPIPSHKGLAVVAFPSVRDAIESVQDLLALGPASIEMLDDLILDLARGNTEYARYVDLLPTGDSGATPKAVLYVEFFGHSAREIDDKLALVGPAAPKGSARTLTDPAKMASAWKLRKAGEPLLHAVEGERKPLGFIEDNAIPVERLSEFVERLRAIVEREGTIASYYAHASVGVLHVRPMLDLRDPEDERAMHRIASETADLARELGGVASGEHGDGRARGPVLERFMGPALMDAHRAIKSIFDPHGLMNPGNIVDPEPLASISSNTRVRPDGVSLTIGRVETAMRYDEEGGFAHAVEMCNGAGVCRQKYTGSMCPSYQGTRDERHSTRGRGNALRLAISGQSSMGDAGGAPDFDDPETLETLKLCLSCKACKSECPSSVDIAKLKSEYLHQRHKQRGVPLRAALLSRVHTLNTLGSIAPPIANLANRAAPTRAVINRVLGLHPQRSLPRFARPIKSVPIPERDAPAVVLVCDTMTTHSEPHIARAARRVLGSLGYAVGVFTGSDFGRSAISQGHLSFAKRLAHKELGRFRRFAAGHEVAAFVHLEPSMMSAILDEWKDLIDDPHDPTLEALRTTSTLVETFVGERWDEHPSRPELREGPDAMRVHTHCHQKALWGSGTTTDALGRLAPGRVSLIDAGCCGMSGAFGYGADTFELSNTIGNQRLMPEVRGRGDTDWIVAGGTSCRHQILDATGVHAIHPIEAIDRLIDGAPGP